METIRLEPVDAVEITTVVDNTYDMLAPGVGPAARTGAAALPRAPRALTVEGAAPDTLVAEHGFSALVTVERAGRRHTVLFDTGVSEDGAVENLRRLGEDLGAIEAVVLSHGHFDHTMGLHGLAGALGRRRLPMVLHPAFWTRRRIAIAGRDPIVLPTISAAAVRAEGFEVIEDPRPSFLLDGALLVTGEVERTSAFETGFPGHESLDGDAWVPDPLILDDQAAVLHVRDRGLVVLTGCGHAGIVNIVHHARRLTGVDRVYAVMGGFHLSGAAFEAVIPETLAALLALQPEVIVPAHCTGWTAQQQIALMFPDAFIQDHVGTRFRL